MLYLGTAKMETMMRAVQSIIVAMLLFIANPLAAKDDSRCADAVTTLEMNACVAAVVAKAEDRQDQYLDAALARHAATPDIVALIEASQAAYATYAGQECDAVYRYWIDGSIRNVMALECRLALTDQRTHTIWRNWLTYVDSTPPDLPEPRPTP